MKQYLYKVTTGNTSRLFLSEREARKALKRHGGSMYMHNPFADAPYEEDELGVWCTCDPLSELADETRKLGL